MAVSNASRKASVVTLHVLVFAIGFYALTSQSIFLREFLVVFFGSELSFGITLCAWLVGIFLGAWVAGRLKERLRDPLSVLAHSVVAMCLVLPVSLFYVRTVRGWTGTHLGEYVTLPQVLLTSFLLTTPFSFFIGFLFPISVRALVEGLSAGEKATRAISRVYIAEALGSIAGGILFSFVLIVFFRTYVVVALVSSALVLTLAWVLAGSGRLLLAALYGTLAGVVLLLVAWGSVSALENASQLRRWKTFSQAEMLLSLDSRYQNIVVAREADQYEVYTNGKVHTTFPDEYGVLQKSALIMAEHPMPKDVLLIGGGLGGLVGRILVYPVERLDYVELDPRILKTLVGFLSEEDARALSDPRFTAYACDGRWFVKACASDPRRLAYFRFGNGKDVSEKDFRYDLVILNLPDPSTAMLNRFYTLEFFREVSKVLKQDGVLALRATSAENYLGQEVGNFTGSIYRTLKAVYPFVTVSPGPENYFFASREPNVTSTEVEVLRRRFRDQGVEPRRYERIYEYLFPEEKTKFIADALSSRLKGSLNTDFHPVSYFYYLLLWRRFAAGGLSSVVRWAGLLRLGHLLLLIAVLLVVGTFGGVFRPAGRIRFNNLVAIAATGFAGLSLEVVILFAYLSVYGYVYEKIGMLVALFMAGLALGALVVTGWLRSLESESNPAEPMESIERITCGILEAHQARLFFILIGVSAFAFLLPFCIGLISSQRSAGFLGEVAFGGLLFAIGFLTGSEFPLAARIHMLTRAEVGKTAAALDAADHFGAAAGALVTGAVLVPVLGLSKCSYFSGALNIASAILVALQIWRSRRGV